MTRLTLLIIGIVGASAASVSPPAPRVALVMPGDTITVTATWTAVSGVTTYDFRQQVTATNGTWSVMFGGSGPFAVPALGAFGGTPGTGPVVIRLIAIPWDSATATFCYRGRRVPARVPADTTAWACRAWRMRRQLGVPLPPSVVDTAGRPVDTLTIGTLPPPPPTTGDSSTVGPLLTDSVPCVEAWARWTRGTGTFASQASCTAQRRLWPGYYLSSVRG